MRGGAAPVVVAFGLPLVLLAAATAWFTREDPPADLPAAARDIDSQLARHPPEVVVVGNSKAGSDIDGDALAEALDVSGPVARLVVYGSGAPAWYALLEQRVYANGYAPRLVVVYGQLGSLLHGSEVSDSERRAIEAVVTGPSEVLDRRVLRRDAGGRARDHATDLREGLLTWARDTGLALVFPGMNPADGRAALDGLFSAARQRTTAETRVVPVAEVRAGAMLASTEDPAAGFLPEIVRLAHENGARVLFVRAPVGGTARAKDTVPAEVEAQLYAFVNAAGASWIDLHELELPAGAFRDDLHMTRAGAARLTAALGERMVAGEVLSGGVLPAAPPLRATAVTRTGAPPALELGAPVAVAGAACRWEVPLVGLDALSDDALYAAGLGHSSPVRLSVGGEALTPHAPRAAPEAPCSGSFAHARGELRVSPVSAPLGPLSATLEAAPTVEGARGEPVTWVYPGSTLTWAMPATPGDRVVVEAVLRPVVGAEAELVVGDRAVPFTADGRVLRARLDLGEQGAPWSIGVRAGAGAWLVVHQLRVDTADPHWIVGHDWARTYLLGAAPQFAERAEVPLPLATTLDEVEARAGVSCLPRLEPKLRRACRAGNAFLPGWLLPGDQATVALSAARMAVHPLGLDTLVLTAAAFADAVVEGGGDAEGEVGVEIVRRRSGAEEVVWSGRTSFPTAGAPERRVLTLDPPLSPLNPHAVRLRVGAAAILVTDALLLEHEAAEASTEAGAR